MKESSFDVAIIGGGIVGAMTAALGGRRGLNVVVLEQEGELFKGASAAGFGSLTPYSDPFFTGAARDFAVRGTRAYRDAILPWISDTTGLGIEFCDKGLLEILEPGAEAVADAQSLLESLKAAGYASEGELLNRDQTLALEPMLARDFDSALYLNEPWLDAAQLYVGLEKAISQSRSVEVLLNCAASALTLSDSGVTITTETHRVHAQTVVLATGVTTNFPRGVAAPDLHWLRGDAMEVVHPARKSVLERHIYRNPGFITPRSGGRLFLGATYTPEYEPPVELARTSQIAAEHVVALLQQNARILPQLLEFELMRTWRQWRPASADGLPIVGPGEHANVIYATGCKGLGLTMAPAVAEAVLNGVVTGTWADVPEDFDPCRDGALVRETAELHS